MTEKLLPPIHPGEILLEEFLEPLGISQYRLAKEIHVPPRRISPHTALRISRFFGTSERFWLNLQTRYDIEMTKRQIGEQLQSEIHPLKSAA